MHYHKHRDKQRQTEQEDDMVIEFCGIKVKIPKGYTQNSEGFFVDRHGVEYALVKYGADDAATICLETIYSKHVRTVMLIPA